MSTDKSKASGSWNDISTWTGAVPSASTNVELTAYDDVTLSGAAGSAKTLTIDANGALNVANDTLTVGSGGLVDNGELSGSGTINGAISGNGQIVADGGTLDLKGPIDTANTAFSMFVDSGATLKIDGAIGLSEFASNVTIGFHGAGTLDLTGEGQGAAGELSKFQAAVRDLTLNDKIIVEGDGQHDTVTYDSTLEALVVKGAGNAILDVVKLDGNYSNYRFTLSESGATDTITVSAICFMAGTRIATPTGEVTVETLKRGDMVLTTDGVARPVTWLGKQTVSTLFADPVRVWPVRIKAGALAPNSPSRDLVLSPDHAVFVDGVLIQAGALVNGTSVVRELTVPRSFVYYHVELEDHALILAENAPSETFIDNADRMAFDNWEEHEALFPKGKVIEELPYARAKGPRQVPVRVRVALAERAMKIGALTADVA
jgi:hypothetical protein